MIIFLQQISAAATTCFLEQYIEYVQWLSGSSFTVGETIEDIIAPQS